MKILQVNVYYKEGSTGKIVFDVQESLNGQGCEMYTAYGRGAPAISKEDKAYRFCNEIEARIHNRFIVLGLSLPYGGCFLSTIRLIRYIKKLNPDVVHLHCINGSCVNMYQIFKYLGKKKIPTVVTNHAEFYYTGSCGYSFDCNKWYEAQCQNCGNVRYSTHSRTISRTHEAWVKMRKAFSYFRQDKLVFTAVSPWVKNRFVLSPIVNKYKCVVVQNGLDTSIFTYNPNINMIKQRVSLAKGKIVLHTTASFWPDNSMHIKGGWYVVELAKKMPNVNFVVVSSKNTIGIKLPSNIYLWGAATNQYELAELYSSADITLLTSKKETFSMVCAESLCCGTPIVGFRAGGPESISIQDYSIFVDSGNVESLADALTKMLNTNYEKDLISEKAKRIYDKSIMAQKYFEVYRSFF